MSAVGRDWTPDAGLCGNGVECPACALRREDLRAARAMDQSVPCNFCAGTGRVGRAVSEIIAEAVHCARAEYWPARETQFARHNAGHRTEGGRHGDLG